MAEAAGTTVCSQGECTGTASTELISETTEYSGSSMSMDLGETTESSLGSSLSMDLVGDGEFGLYETIAEEDILDTLSMPSTPTYVPTSSPPPSAADNGFTAIEKVRSSGFTARHSFQVRMALTVMAILVATLFIPGREGAGHNLLGLGKVLVAAAAVSSLFSRAGKNNVRRNVLQHRKLQDQCTYNVEILYDGCTKNVVVNAPAARVIDVVMEDYASEANENDECQTDYSANLTFPIVENTTEVDLANNNTVGAYSYSDWQCLRAIEGRPFIDASGKGIQALPMQTESCVGEISVKWSGEVSTTFKESFHNSTSHNQVILGNEWTQRALGEHSSIASFSAFSIALMTNQAPSSLVEDSLKAGLDEIRHARTSFDIASKLLGKNVEPSSLPESKHEFDHDLTALALAVAREGCVDETLSALSAAAEVESINSFLENGSEGSKYSNISHDVLRWIRDELRTIALDESNHSALAWRTLKWVCSVDSDACSAVQKQVFDETKLEMRFQQRSEGKAWLADAMKREWEKMRREYV